MNYKNQIYSFFIHDEKKFSRNYSLPSGYQFFIFTPSFLRLSLHGKNTLLYYFWYICSFGKYKIYYVMFDNSVVHFSHILPKIPRFKFMKKGDFEIGPCWTDPNHRGKNLYPCTLKKII